LKRIDYGATLRSFAKAIKLFGKIFDVPVTWKKISLGLPDSTKKLINIKYIAYATTTKWKLQIQVTIKIGKMTRNTIRIL